MKKLRKPISELTKTDIFDVDFVKGKYKVETPYGNYFPNQKQAERLFEINPGEFTVRAVDTLFNRAAKTNE